MDNAAAPARSRWGWSVMGRRRDKPKTPDGVLDVDRGADRPGLKVATQMDPVAAGDRHLNRVGLRGLDEQVEAMQGLTRAGKDANRAVPRATVGDLGHPRKERMLPAPGQTRIPVSARQRNARTSARLEAQRATPRVQREATRGVLSRPARWSHLNDLLSEHTGDAQELEEPDRREVQRVDRFIQRAERGDRGHVVYANVALPTDYDGPDRATRLQAQFHRGTVLEFDRYTVGSHQMHETAALAPDPHTLVLEIQTRRGAYLGTSARAHTEDTTHLLPRGLRLQVVDVHQATYQAPDGTTGTRTVLQLRDPTPPGPGPNTRTP